MRGMKYETFEAARAFCKTATKDQHDKEGCALFHEWVVFDAFLAGVEYARWKSNSGDRGSKDHREWKKRAALGEGRIAARRKGSSGSARGELAKADDGRRKTGRVRKASKV